MGQLMGQLCDTCSGQSAVQEVDFFGDLRIKLDACEKNKPEQDRIFSNMQVKGFLMIATVEIQGPEISAANLLKTLAYLRALLAARVWNDKVRLVKPDECKFFVFGETADATLKAALQIAQLAKAFPHWLGTVTPGLNLQEPTVKIGIESGQVLLLPGDCYGNPVNVASKLGEDLAEDGHMCLGEKFVQNVKADMSANAMYSRLTTEAKSAEISHVNVNYISVPLASAIEAMPPGGSLPASSELTGSLGSAGLSDEPTSARKVVFVTDMSGFTNLTQAYGILHFLRLVLNARHILVPLITQEGGEVVKYDGDNIIATFPTPQAALCCIKAGWEQVDKYNKPREDSKDFQIRMGCSVCFGEVLLHGTEIIGEAFERSFYLAEEMSEVGDVLVTNNFRAELKTGDAVSFDVVTDERAADYKAGKKVKYHGVSFKPKEKERK